jgi:hypothetical protein
MGQDSRRTDAPTLAARRAHSVALDGQEGRRRHGDQDARKRYCTARTRAMQYRIQFVDGSANVLREWSANARSVAGVLSLVTDIDWPPRAVAMRVLDANGREVHSAIKGDTKN